MNGKCVPPNYDLLQQLTGVKYNTAYVRYRDISNPYFKRGLKVLQPIGDKAIAEAAELRRGPGLSAGLVSSFDTQSTPVSTPTATAATTVTSSPVKKSSTKKRKRASDEDDDAEIEEEEYDPDLNTTKPANNKKRKMLDRPAAPPRIAAQLLEPEFEHDVLDFDCASGLLAVDEHHRFEVGRSSDADAEGESDDEA